MTWMKHQTDDALEVLEAVELGDSTQTVTLSSGRRYELEAGDVADRIVVRSARGQVLLRVAVTDEGPLLAFENAEITLSARKRLSLTAPELCVEAEKVGVHARTVRERIGGDKVTTVGGVHHTRVRGEERLEAGSIAMQANDDGCAIRAMRRIDLDGEHIGLNDDPCPTAYAWSALAEGGQS